MLAVVERSVARKRQRGVQRHECVVQAPQIVVTGVGNDVGIGCRPQVTVSGHGDTPDHHVVDVVGAERGEQRPQVELIHALRLAAPTIAVICLQSSLSRVRRSFIPKRQSASRRALEPCSSSCSGDVPAVLTYGAGVCWSTV